MKIQLLGTTEGCRGEQLVAKVIIDTEANTLTVYETWDRQVYKLVPVDTDEERNPS